MTELSKPSALPQTTYEFFDDFIEAIEQSSTEAGLMTMQLEEGPATGEIFDTLSNAHSRGVNVKIQADPYALRMTRVWNRDVPNFLPLINRDARRERKAQYGGTKKRIQQLGELGILDIPSAAPSTGLMGRLATNHIKLAYADNVAWIGTMNFTDSDIYEPGWIGSPEDYDEDKDYDGRHMVGMSNSMVRLTNPSLVAQIKEIAGIRSGLENSHTVPSGFELLLDEGKSGESLIYDRAIEIVSRAEEQIWFLGQYLPDGPLLDALLSKVKQGVEVFITTQTNGDHRVRTFPYSLMVANFKARTLRAPETFMVERQISPSHNKALIVDGKEVLYGSHNLLRFLVKRIGVRELCLWSDDPAFTEDLQDLLFQNDLLGRGRGINQLIDMYL